MAGFLARRRLPRLLAYTAATILGGATTTVAGLHFWGRHCEPERFGPETDAVFSHAVLKTCNPKRNPSAHDSLMREIPFEKVKPELLEDALNGGQELLNEFAAGLFGGYGFSVQRKLLKWAKKDGSNASDLWEAEELAKSKYPKDTIIADDFVVVDRTPDSILLRGGGSPREPGLREFDSLSVVSVVVDKSKRTVRFSLKSIAYNGADDGAGVPLNPAAWYLHEVYARFLVTAGVSRCIA